MTRRSATKIGSAALWSLFTTTVMVVMAANVDEDTAPAADTDWGCVAAAAEYQNIGDVNSVPTTLIEGESLLHVFDRLMSMPCCASVVKCRVSVFRFSLSDLFAKKCLVCCFVAVKSFTGIQNFRMAQ